ncbi:putative transposase [Shigella flexneri SFJ17B]|nr:putative transposase [Shigella flexneri SFJ17B]
MTMFWRQEKVHADDTPVKVLAPGNGKTKTGRLWGIRLR